MDVVVVVGLLMMLLVVLLVVVLLAMEVGAIETVRGPSLDELLRIHRLGNWAGPHIMVVSVLVVLVMFFRGTAAAAIVEESAGLHIHLVVDGCVRRDHGYHDGQSAENDAGFHFGRQFNCATYPGSTRLL